MYLMNDSTCPCLWVWNEEGKGREKSQEEAVDEEIGVVDVATISLPLVVEKTDGQRVLQELSTLSINLKYMYMYRGCKPVITYIVQLKGWVVKHTKQQLIP